MQRRAFLKKLGLGVAVVAVAPMAVEKLASQVPGRAVHGTPIIECTTPSGLVLKDYAEYTNFSEFVRCEQIDQIVEDAAAELGKQFGERIGNLYASVKDDYQPVAFGRGW